MLASRLCGVAAFGRGSRRALSNFHPLAQHVDTSDNTPQTTFDFTPDNHLRAEHILAKYPKNYKMSGIIPLLDLAQRQSGGWLPLAAMDKVAKYVGVAPMRVYEVASRGPARHTRLSPPGGGGGRGEDREGRPRGARVPRPRPRPNGTARSAPRVAWLRARRRTVRRFYTMFNREKVGKYFIQLCGTTPCMVCGSEAIKHAIEDHLGIKEGETTKDGLFTLREVECLGACANAPMIQMNDDYYECLTPKSVVELLEACKAGEAIPMGRWGSLPLNGQVSCEGPAGKTTLSVVPGPQPIREGGFNGEVDPASVKAHMGY